MGIVIWSFQEVKVCVGNHIGIMFLLLDVNDILLFLAVRTSMGEALDSTCRLVFVCFCGL
jgi:hypothetical protein